MYEEHNINIVTNQGDTVSVSQARDLPFLMRHDIDLALLERVQLTGTGNRRADDVARSVVASAILSERQDRATAYSRKKSFYVGMDRYGGANYQLAPVTAAVDHVADLGLIEKMDGFWRSNGNGRQSTFRATPLLLERAGIAARVIARPGETVMLRDASKGLMAYRDTSETRAMRRDLTAWSETVAASDIRLSAPDVVWVEDGSVSVPHGTKGGGPIRIDTGASPLFRVFNNGDFTQGGRAYGHWCQSLPSERRAQITIDAEPVALLDFSASHPRQLYALAGLTLDGDPYEIEGHSRDMAKVATLVVLNASSRRQGIEAMAHKLADGGPVSRHHRDIATALLKALEIRHAPIASQFYRGTGLACQRREADVLGDVARQARQEGICVLPVHDELIAPVGKSERIRELMVDHWTQRMGSAPVVK